jgi:acetoin utilization deacetylase AcuC-like enzyme
MTSAGNNTAYLTHPSFVAHDLEGHVEHAGRIRRVWQVLAERNLPAELKACEPEPASEELILEVHNREHLDLLKEAEALGETVLIDADTYFTPHSLEVAKLAVGAVAGAVSEVLSGCSNNALAAVRPPGHHATRDSAMGFCLLNNVAVAARLAQLEYGVGRVMIVDFDVHHGNGTQDIFYRDGGVLFVSIHQQGIFPLSGGIEETGTGGGEGFTVNLPLEAGHGDETFLALLEEILWPLARRFAPELMLVSAGFDAHWRDPLASLNMSLKGFAELAQGLIAQAGELCNGRIVFATEGGYDLEVLGHGVANLAALLSGKGEIHDPLGPGVQQTHEIRALLQALRQAHSL